MCGIAGLLYPSPVNAPDRGAMVARLDAMASAIAHRGPDGDGFWQSDDARVGLAHRRLAIIDLSPEAAQPMRSAEGDLWITYNGEIYNHAQLRQDLEAAGHRFRTDHSDTEVLIYGYREWGLEGLVGRLEGMFAFAIWDAGRRVLSLARDRIGIKPIYFTRAGGIFRFASEIKALFADPSVPRAMASGALGHYLTYMVTPAPLTLFKGVYKIPAGHLMEVSAEGKVRAWRYWDALPGRGPAPNTPAADLAAGVLDRLEAAISKRMMSDVPFGVFLSGGIDSSANVALMDRVSTQPVKTFTVGFKDHTQLNELDYARAVAERFNTDHHEVLVDSRDMQGYLTDLIHHQDEPIADWVCVPLYFVSKLARESGVTVVQVGEGSDEQFCGYDSWMRYLD
ncbi:MAG: asparagine synthase (glutamine-hydrolyzing), partial [Rhodospirillaceae bacterium]